MSKCGSNPVKFHHNCLKSAAKRVWTAKDWRAAFHRKGVLTDLPDAPMLETLTSNDSFRSAQQTLTNPNWYKKTICHRACDGPWRRSNHASVQGSVNCHPKLSRGRIDCSSHSCWKHPMCEIHASQAWSVNEGTGFNVRGQPIRCWDNECKKKHWQIKTQRHQILCNPGVERGCACCCETCDWSHQPDWWPNKTTWPCTAFKAHEVPDGLSQEANQCCLTKQIHRKWHDKRNHTNQQLLCIHCQTSQKNEEIQFPRFGDWKTVPVRTLTW